MRGFKLCASPNNVASVCTGLKIYDDEVDKSENIWQYLPLPQCCFANGLRNSSAKKHCEGRLNHESFRSVYSSTVPRDFVTDCNFGSLFFWGGGGWGWGIIVSCFLLIFLRGKCTDEPSSVTPNKSEKYLANKHGLF